MEVVFQHHEAVDSQVIVSLLVGPGVEQNLSRLGAGEDGQPFDDGAGQEVGQMGLGEMIAAAGHGVLGV